MKPADICVRLAGQPASSFVIVVNVGRNPVKEEQFEFSALFKSLTRGDFFIVRIGFGCLEKFPANRLWRCEQYTHNYSTYRVAHSTITFHHANTRVSRIVHLCVLEIIVIHVSCLTFNCLLPLLTFHRLSQTPTTLLEHDEHLGPDGRPHCDDLRQTGGFTQTVTPTLTIRYGS